MTQTQLNKESPQLGEGIYAANDISEILKLPYHKVRILIKGFWQTRTFGERRNKTVNFLSLIEFYIYYYLREQNISAQAIKKLHTKLSKDFDTSYPFASLQLKTHGNEVWIDFKGNLMKADGKLQPTFRTFIDPFLKQVEYGDDLLAKRFFPLHHSHNVVVDPKKQFGKPIIQDNGVRTEVIYKFHLGGETNESICKLYNLQTEQVQDAITFHQQAA